MLACAGSVVRIGETARGPRLVAVASEIEQARIRLGRLDQPRVQAETSGASVSRAQPADADLTAQPPSRAAEPTAAGSSRALDHSASGHGLIRLSLDLRHFDQDRERTRKRRDRIVSPACGRVSARLMAAPLAPSRSRSNLPVLDSSRGSRPQRFECTTCTAALPSRSVSSSGRLVKLEQP